MSNIKTALILAAGIGKRLQPLTNSIPKCLVEIDEKPLLNRNIEILINLGFEKLILVTGYKSEMIEMEVEKYSGQIEIEFVYNSDYDTTNNIYSLWLAEPNIKDPFVLIESDLFLLPETLIHFKRPDQIALDIFDPDKHCGTTALVDSNGNLENLICKGDPAPGYFEKLFKTVNIYSFSLETWSKIYRKINDYIRQKKLNIFYEVAIGDLARNREINLKMVNFSDQYWDEIDTPEDLDRITEFVKNQNINISVN